MLAEPFHEHLNRVLGVGNSLERATIVPRAGRRQRRRALARFAAARIHAGAELLLAAPIDGAVDGGSGEAHVRDRRANALEVDVAASGGYLLLSEMDYPGWRAEVDAPSGHLVRANYAFRALPIQPRDRRVRIVYDPLSLKLGALVSGVALGAAVGLLLLPTWLQRRRRERPGGVVSRPGLGRPDGKTHRAL